MVEKASDLVCIQKEHLGGLCEDYEEPRRTPMCARIFNLEHLQRRYNDKNGSQVALFDLCRFYPFSQQEVDVQFAAMIRCYFVQEPSGPYLVRLAIVLQKEKILQEATNVI